jgi:hypothetical protein
VSVSGRYVAEIAGDQNEALVQRFYAEGINGRDLDLESVLQQLGALPQS